MSRRKIQGKKRNSREQRGKSTLIYCQGTETEPEYFKELKKIYRLPGIHIKAEAKTPHQLVKIAKRVANRDGRELLFVVIDVDDTPRKEIELAIAECRKSSIETYLIISNPCFDAWIYMHDRKILPPSKPTREIVSHIVKLQYVNKENIKKIRKDIFPFTKWPEANANNHQLSQKNEWVTDGGSAVGFMLEKILNK